MHQHLGEEGAHLTDAHHAWAWGAVWRGGEGGDLKMVRQFFSSSPFWVVLTWGIWISCFMWIGFEPFQC